MSIWLASKAVLLFGAVFLIVPIVFVLFLTVFGSYFSLAIAKDSWVARTKNRVIRSLFTRFIVH